jgi:hypothetical protein
LSTGHSHRRFEEYFDYIGGGYRYYNRERGDGYVPEAEYHSGEHRGWVRRQAGGGGNFNDEFGGWRHHHGGGHRHSGEFSDERFSEGGHRHEDREEFGGPGWAGGHGGGHRRWQENGFRPHFHPQIPTLPPGVTPAPTNIQPQVEPLQVSLNCRCGVSSEFREKKNVLSLIKLQNKETLQASYTLYKSVLMLLVFTNHNVSTKLYCFERDFQVKVCIRQSYARF